jgi:NhaP-type Na+/H+ or K+/H+ antiporter
MLFAVCSMVHANEYVAAFSAGMTMASVQGDLTEEFEAIGEPIAELMKLAALLVFGALFSWEFLQAMSWQGYLFAALALIAVRPAALCVALIGDGMPKDQFAAAAWFGPKGFASVTYGLMVLRSGTDHARDIFGLAALVIAMSIVAHSSTDVAVAGWIIRRQQNGSSPGQQPARST